MVEPWFVFSERLKFNLYHQKWFFMTQLEFFDDGWTYSFIQWMIRGLMGCLVSGFVDQKWTGIYILPAVVLQGVPGTHQHKAYHCMLLDHGSEQ